MSENYDDGTVGADASGVRIGRYYFPWGAKRIPYAKIKGLQRVVTSNARGKWRIWGTGNIKYWANLDPKRPRKNAGFILDNGSLVKPFITPDDPDSFETLVRDRAGLGPSGATKKSPYL